MYGKFFASTFTGSMFGAGTDVFALWGYVIATANEGVVEVNPAFVAAVLGTSPERIAAALAVLCDPDAESRSEAEDGRRLVHEGAYQYRVVNHAHYRAIRNEEDRRAYNREAKRRERERKSSVVKPDVNESQACQPIQKQSTEAEAEAEAEGDAVPSAPRFPPPISQHKGHRSHAFCSRACVPAFLHDEFIKALGGTYDDADATLRQGYVRHAADWPDDQPTGEPIKFWRSWFAATWPAPKAKDVAATAERKRQAEFFARQV